MRFPLVKETNIFRSNPSPMNLMVGLGVLTPPPSKLDTLDGRGGVRTPSPTGLWRFRGSMRENCFQRILTLNRSVVAQISNLLYRRFPIGKRWDNRSALGSSSTRQVENLRYCRLEICATALRFSVRGKLPSNRAIWFCMAQWCSGFDDGCDRMGVFAGAHQG